MKGRWSPIVLALALVSALNWMGGAAVAADTVRWQIDSGTAYSTREDWCVVQLDKFTAAVAKRSNDAFKPIVSIAGELGTKSDEVPKTLAAGRIQGGVMATGHIAGSFPFLNVYGLPFLFSSLEEGQKVHQAIKPIADREFRKMGFAPAAFYIMTPVGLWSKVEIPDLTKLNNLKVRCWDEVTSNIVKNLGGVPIIMPVTEAYTALQRGVIDAVLTGAPAMLQISGQEVCKFGYLINLAPACIYLCYNTAAFDKLSKEFQEIFMSEAASMEKAFLQAQPIENSRSIDQMKAAGVKLTTPGPEQMAALKTAVRPIWQNWIEKNGPIAAEAAKAAMDAVGAK